MYRDDNQQTQTARIIVVKEWRKAQGGGMIPHDRRLCVEEWMLYEPRDGVNIYAFREMDEEGIRPMFGAEERLFDGHNVREGERVLVGKFMETKAYLATLSGDARINTEANFKHELMCGVCVHPDGEISEVRGTETLFNPITHELVRVSTLDLSFD